MQAVQMTPLPSTILKEENQANTDASANESGDGVLVGPSAREILLGRNAQISAKGQVLISVGSPATSEDSSTKSRGLFCKALNVILLETSMLRVEKI
jgi:hypothetical protein